VASPIEHCVTTSVRKCNCAPVGRRSIRLNVRTRIAAMRSGKENDKFPLTRQCGAASLSLLESCAQRSLRVSDFGPPSRR
jgi:hypothetical protein